MDWTEYQKNAQRTASSVTLEHKALNGWLGIMGESGEVADVVKKYLFQSGTDAVLPVNKLIDEVGDVLWYVAEEATAANLDMANIMSGQMTDKRGLATMDEAGKRRELISAVRSLQRAAQGVSDNVTYDTHLTCRGIGICLCAVVRDLATLCGVCGEPLESAAARNINKLKKRYPDGFDANRSMYRPEYIGKTEA